MKGWKLVPVEPTEEMQFSWNNGKTSTHQRLRERWVNALAAAPTPPAQPDELRKAAGELLPVLQKAIFARSVADFDQNELMELAITLRAALEQKQ